MKLKSLIAMSAIMMASQANANIFIDLPWVSFNQDACNNIPGVWAGGGKVKAGIIECHYSGTAKVTHISGTQYEMNVNLSKDSGICPDAEALILPGTCEGGLLKLNTDSANLQGTLNSEGNTVDLNGKVTFNVMGTDVVADVDDMRMQKQ